MANVTRIEKAPSLGVPVLTASDFLNWRAIDLDRVAAVLAGAKALLWNSDMYEDSIEMLNACYLIDTAVEQLVQLRGELDPSKFVKLRAEEASHG